MLAVDTTKLFCLLCAVHITALAQETESRSVSVPLYSKETSTTYTPSKSDYNREVQERVDRMKSGDHSAFVNPRDQPTKDVATKTTVGVEFKGGGGISQSHQEAPVTTKAAEDALKQYEQEHSK